MLLMDELREQKKTKKIVGTHLLVCTYDFCYPSIFIFCLHT